MDAAHPTCPDARSARLPAVHSAPENSDPGALKAAASSAVAATASGLACCSADCPKEQAGKSAWFLVHC